MKTLKFGVEVEVVGLERWQLARAVHAVTGGRPRIDFDFCQVTMPDGRVWKVIRDLTLESGEHSGEIVSPILRYRDLALVQRIVRVVRELGGAVDETCGMHVHVDGAGLDAQAITALVRLIHPREQQLQCALGISATRLSRYCRPIDPAFIRALETRKPLTLDGVRRAWFGGDEPVMMMRCHASRDHGLNLNSLFFRGTVEYRYFNGTLDADEVTAYVQLALALTAKAMNGQPTRREPRAVVAAGDFEGFLLDLGLDGSEFEGARRQLLKRLAEDAAASTVPIAKSA